MGLLAALGVAGVGGAHHLDPGNTQISFEVGHLGLNWFTAEFSELSGEFALAPDGSGGRLSVTVRMASLKSRSPYWNERLRSPQWLDTERYPEMRFHSSGIEIEGEQRATVHGELTLHGVTHPLALAISEIDCPQVGEATPGHCHFLGRGFLRRSDYGLPHGFWAGGDEVEILVRGD